MRLESEDIVFSLTTIYLKSLHGEGVMVDSYEGLVLIQAAKEIESLRVKAGLIPAKPPTGTESIETGKSRVRKVFEHAQEIIRLVRPGMDMNFLLSSGRVRVTSFHPDPSGGTIDLDRELMFREKRPNGGSSEITIKTGEAIQFQKQMAAKAHLPDYETDADALSAFVRDTGATPLVQDGDGS